MPLNSPSIPDDILQRAKSIRLAAFDVDGTLTDGHLWYTEQGQEIKAFHAHDGHGLKLLMAHGIEVAIITARQSRPVTLRANELGITYVFQGQSDKKTCLMQLQEALKLTVEQTAFVGDDLSDVPAMQQSGLAIAVANAHQDVLPWTHWQTNRSGGSGAAREACDLILAAQKDG